VTLFFSSMYRTMFKAATAVIGKQPSSSSLWGKEQRIVVLGTGWGGYQIALNIKKNLPLTVVSPSNHFVFTPLLPSTTVGTLEFRCIQEPVRQGKLVLFSFRFNVWGCAIILVCVLFTKSLFLHPQSKQKYSWSIE
jgi:hypothetical protein